MVVVMFQGQGAKSTLPAIPHHDTIDLSNYSKSDDDRSSEKVDGKQHSSNGGGGQMETMNGSSDMAGVDAMNNYFYAPSQVMSTSPPPPSHQQSGRHLQHQHQHHHHHRPSQPSNVPNHQLSTSPVNPSQQQQRSHPKRTSSLFASGSSPVTVNGMSQGYSQSQNGRHGASAGNRHADGDHRGGVGNNNGEQPTRSALSPLYQHPPSANGNGHSRHAPEPQGYKQGGTRAGQAMPNTGPSQPSSSASSSANSSNSNLPFAAHPHSHPAQSRPDLAAVGRPSSFFGVAGQGAAGPSASSSSAPSQGQSNPPQRPSYQSGMRANSFFGALDAPFEEHDDEPQASRSYIQREKSPQPASFGTTASYQHPSSSAAQAAGGGASSPVVKSTIQPAQPTYHSTSASIVSSSGVLQGGRAQQQQQNYQHQSRHSSTTNSISMASRSSFYGVDGHTGQNDAGPSGAQYANSNEYANHPRSRSQGRISPQYSGRQPSQSLPRLETGQSISSAAGYHSGPQSAQAGEQQHRRRVSSWGTRSNPGSVYGFNAASPTLSPSGNDGALPPIPAVPLLSQAHLRPGDQASLLTHAKTLELYRANVKKTNDPEVTFELATFMLGIAREIAVNDANPGGGQNGADSNGASEENLLYNTNGHTSSSPSPDPSISFHSRSSGSSGENPRPPPTHHHSISSLSALAGNLGLRKRTSQSPAPPSSNASVLNMDASIGSSGTPGANAGIGDRRALVSEALSLLKRNADRGHNPSQFFLADCYAQGLVTSRRNSGVPNNNASLNGTTTGQPSSVAATAAVNAFKPDYDKALPLFIAAAKHGHPASCFRAGQCFEKGWGCRKDTAKAVQFYRKAASSSYPEAMYRLGMAELNGELGLNNRQKEGFKWLKRVAELAESSDANDALPSDDPLNPNGNAAARHCAVQALHELALLHERGIENVVFIDNEYAAELLARASELGYAPSAYKLGECYEYGKMGCPQDSALSIHYYNIAAQQNHKEACFALTAWYLVGSPGVLPQSDTEAYLWAKKAAEQGLAKAEYAVGYFTEVGIGTIRDEREAITWFRKAAEHGDKRAITRLRTLTSKSGNVHAAESYASSPTPKSPTFGGRGSNLRHAGRRLTSFGMTNNPSAQSQSESDQDAPTHGQKAGKKADGDCVVS